MTLKVNYPNVYLFAYHLIESNKEGDSPLWKDAQNILDEFNSKERLLNQLEFNINSHGLTKLLKSEPSKLKSSIPLFADITTPSQGFIQPLQIHDSYALFFNIGTPEKSDAENMEVGENSIFKSLNPNNILPLSYKNEDRFLGQTLLITGAITSTYQTPTDQYLQDLANACASSFVDKPIDDNLYRQGNLFGSPIFEYGLISNIESYQHTLVFLFKNVESSKKLDQISQQLIKLFFYRSKIVKAFQDSRLVHEGLGIVYSELIDSLKAELGEDKINLNETKIKLKRLMKDSVSYTELLKKLEYYKNTIDINLYNYNQTIQQIVYILKIPETEVDFLKEFSDKTAPYFQSQIQGDLGYFQHGTDLISEAIASIRGIVEIEQVKSDRQLQQTLQDNEIKEKERDRQLQNTIAIAGVGIGVAGVTATAFPYYLKPADKPEAIQLLPWNSSPHPITKSISISLGIGLLASFSVWGLIQLWRIRKLHR